MKTVICPVCRASFNWWVDGAGDVQIGLLPRHRPENAPKPGDGLWSSRGGFRIDRSETAAEVDGHAIKIEADEHPLGAVTVALATCPANEAFKRLGTATR